MLNRKNLDNRSFDSRMSEAYTELPLYTEDWTNFNPSDPGVTILENLTAFNNVQLEGINAVTDAVRYYLLKMCGFESKRGKAAKVLLMGKNLTEEVILPANKQLKLGDMCFETDRLSKVYHYHINNVYGFYENEYHDVSRIAIGEVDIPTEVFGKSPKAGDAVYFLADGMPEPGEELICYVNIQDRYNRNPFLEKGNNIFADISWQVYTDEGFVTVNVKDGSAGFLMDGEIRMKMPTVPTAVFTETPKEGYCFRAVIKTCDYDIPPKVLSIYGFMFEVFQKETLSSAITFQKSTNIKVFSDLAEKGHIRVFGKEEKGTSYRLYNMALSGEEEGRYYRLIKQGPGMYEIEFDKDAYGYEPVKVKNSVKVLMFGDELMRKYSLGRISGFDRENIYLPIKHIMPATFSIMARRINDDGEYIYDFVRPGKKEEGSLQFILYETEGRIVIDNPGEYVGAELFIATAAVNAGKDGNIRAGNTFKIMEGEFVNPGKGVQGCFRESLPELHRRFLLDIQKPYVAVTERDYEALVKEIPELCIRKVKAYADSVKNLVKVAVMPGTDDKFPKLNDLYEKEIFEYLDMRRLLTTRIEVVQPVYVPVNVFGTVYTKKHFGDCREDIEKAICEKLDYINNDCEFGQRLKFNEVFKELELLPCVEYIYDLSLVPGSSGRIAKSEDGDIVIKENALLYPGQISLDIVAYQD